MFALRPGAREEVMEVKYWRQNAPGRGNSEDKGAHAGENLASLKMAKARVSLSEASRTCGCRGKGRACGLWEGVWILF